jgi:hypothetical protein
MPHRTSFAIVLLVTACSLPSIPDTSLDETSTAVDEESGPGTSGRDSGEDGATSSGTTSPTTSGAHDESDDSSGGVTQSTGEVDTGAECDPDVRGMIYVTRDYETEDPEELFVEPVATSVYLEGECWQGSNCWQVNPISTGGNEDHAGWISAEIPPLAEGGTQTMFIGHMLYVSSGLIDAFVEHRVGGKMIDGYMWDQPDGGGPTRQTVIWHSWYPENFTDEFVDTSAAGVIPSLRKGGAGGGYVRQRGEVQFDLADYADQWIWLELEFNAAERYTAMWVKTQDGVFSGASCEPVMWRSADDPADWHFEYFEEDPYEYVEDAGWQTPGLVWGYWDDLENAQLDEDDFVRLDHMVVSDSWIAPPF